ncbi:flavin reductase [Acetobacter sp. AN02]|uniref:flavin reductase n=1 Tax=Acetobacter sp. AN02 TaxID=2894186 RepID=UPI0024343799|nr:flavin reductase [Acetobacter sp. AN02]MDG6095385.1 flavin reductase [Acetobacter sp. AN02]
MLAVGTEEFREAMSRLGAAVNIVTTGTVEDPAGFTASAVCSVSDSPPTLLVCLNRSARIRPAFSEGGAMCVNVLSAAQKVLSASFAAPSDMKDRFATGHWSALETGAPALSEALASFDCRIRQIVEVGSHSVMFGEIEAIRLGTGRGGLMWFNRAYHDLPHGPAARQEQTS